MTSPNNNADRTPEDIQAELEIRQLVALRKFKMPKAVKTFALFRDAVRDSKLPAEDAAYLEQFSTSEKHSLIDDKDLLKKAGWRLVAKMLTGIQVPVSDLDMASSSDKRIHEHTINSRITEVMEANQLLSEDSTKQEHKDWIKENTADFFIPIARAINTSPDLMEAVRCQTFGETLRADQQKLLSDNEQVVHNWNELLFVVGTQHLAAPANNLYYHIVSGDSAFLEAYYPDPKDSIPPAENFHIAAEQFTGALRSLSAMKETLHAIEPSDIKVSGDLLKQLEDFGKQFRHAYSKWTVNYDEKWYEKLIKAARKMASGNAVEKKIASEFIAIAPLAPGKDANTETLFSDYEKAVTNLKKVVEGGKDSMPADAPEFSDVYTSLLALRERMELSVHRARMVKEEAANVANPNALVKDFIKVFCDYSHAIAEGDKGFPTAPVTIREKASDLIASLEQHIDVYEQAIITFKRAEPLLTSLQAYALEHSGTEVTTNGQVHPRVAVSNEPSSVNSRQ